MILHTALTAGQAGRALRSVKEAGLVTRDVTFTRFTERGSRTHARAFDVQLGTCDKGSLPPGTRDQHGKLMRVRRYKNSGTDGACRVYAATWHEWGWLIAEIFAADPGARFGDYSSPEDFHAKTSGQFSARPLPYPPGAGVNISEHEGQQGDPDYVSPALQAAREQLASSQEFLDHIDTIVFGPR